MERKVIKTEVDGLNVIERVQLALRLNVNPKSVDRLVKRGVLKAYTLDGLSRKKFFKIQDVNNAFEEEKKQRA